MSQENTVIKGVILAGGKGTRLFPLTKVTNKHLLPIGKEPMIYHPVKQLVGAGIKEILVVTSTDHMGDVVNLLGSGKVSIANSLTRFRKKPWGSHTRWPWRRTSRLEKGSPCYWQTVSSSEPSNRI